MLAEHQGGPGFNDEPVEGAELGFGADGHTVADVLVEAAIAHGGHDNVSVVFVEATLGKLEDLDHAGVTREWSIDDVENTNPRGL